MPEFRISGLLAALLCVVASAVWALDPPTLTAPANGAVDVPFSQLYFTYDAPNDADAVHWQFSTDPGFTVLTFEEIEYIANPSNSTIPVEEGKTYYWRMSSIADGPPREESAWSPVWTFTAVDDSIITALDPPTLTSPLNGATGLWEDDISLEFLYNPAATSRHLQMATDAAFANLVVDDLAEMQFPGFYMPIRPNTTYYWRLRVILDGPTDIVSPWSAAWSFTTANVAIVLDQPTLLLPDDKTADLDPDVIFYWMPPTGATSQRFQLSTDPTFATTIIDDVSPTRARNGAIETVQPGTTYYWRVAGIDDGPPVKTGPWSAVYSFTTKAPTGLPAPVLLAPADGLATPNPSATFTWQTVPGAASYRLQVSESPTFATTVVAADITGGGTTSQPHTLTPGATYFWRVAASADATPTTLGAWATPYTLTILGTTGLAAPTLLTPAAGATDIAVEATLTWEPVPDATSHRVQVSTAANFATTLVDELVPVATTSWSLTLQPDTTYYWRVNGANDGPPVEVGPWATARSFTTAGNPPIGDTITLLDPPDGATNQSRQPWLTWQPLTHPNFLDYHLQVAEDPDFTRIVRNHPRVLDEQATVPRHGRPIGPSWQVRAPLDQGKTYYWRVCAVLTTGEGPWSAPWSLTVTTLDVPNTAGPGDGAQRVQNPTHLTWSTVPGATGYTVQVSTDPTFQTGLVVNTTTTGNRLDGVALNPGTAYYWRVSAQVGAQTSPWSDASAFTTTGLTRPSPQTPADNATDVAAPVALQWEAVPGATGYIIEAARDRDFTQLRVQATSTTNTYTMPALDSGASYFWRVRAVDGADMGAWSSVYSFSTARAASQPDLLVRMTPGGAYYGWCYYHSTNGQSLTQPASAAAPGVFLLGLRNTGLRAETYVVTGISDGDGWQITAKDARGQDITAALLGAGWQVTLGVGELHDITITMTPNGAMPYTRRTITLKAIAQANAALYDVAAITATHTP